MSIDDRYVADLRAVLAGRLADNQIDGVIGDVLDRFQRRGDLAAARGTAEWRQAARVLADAELNALERVVERDEGVAPHVQEHPAHLVMPEAQAEPHDPVKFVSLKGLLERHILHLEKDGRGRRQHLSAKTVKDGWMAAVKAVLGHAVEDRKLKSSPALEVRVRMPKRTRVREPDYSDEEAAKILRASRSYVTAASANPATRESPHITAAKRWGPLLCAFTGARVAEIMQLRKGDVQTKSGRVIVRITPEAGSVKDRHFREVPLHAQILELGFLDFVNACDDGPLFYSKEADPNKRPADTSARRLSTWLRESGLAPEGVQPNHGWRHRFKTQAIDLLLNERVYDAIQGHAGKTASDGYGTVSLKAKAEAIDRFPRYAI